MALRNTPMTWGLPARVLHWITAAMIVFMIGFGVWMTGFTERSGVVRLPLYGIHAWVGMCVLTFIVARLVWRLVNVTPAPPAGGAAWQTKAAGLVHGVLYVLIGAQCLLGWALVGTFPADARQQMSGIDMVPMLFTSTDRSLHENIEVIHYAVAMTIAALVVLHVAAALHHHIVVKNDVLTRMWKGASRGRG